MRKGVDRYLQRFREQFIPLLERVHRLVIGQIDSQGNLDADSTFLHDVVGLFDGVRNAPPESNTNNAVLTCYDPLNKTNWLVLVPKYLVELKSNIPDNKDNLGGSVCPAYQVGDPIFVGRMADPIYVGGYHSNHQSLTGWKDNGLWLRDRDGVGRTSTAVNLGAVPGNTHPLISNAGVNSVLDQNMIYRPEGAANTPALPAAVHPSVPSTSFGYDGGVRMGFNPMLFCFYVDLNADGRTRCSGGGTVTTIEGGDSTPNVWL
jgi:hypothetical protein